MVLSRAYPVHLLLLLSIIPTIFSSIITNNGRTLSINDINYYVGGTVVSRLTGQPNGTLSRAAPHTDGDIIPMTVMRMKKTAAGGLEEMVKGYMEKDDVFQEGFLRAIFLAHDGNGQQNTIESLSINENETKVVMAPHNNQHSAHAQNPAIVTAALETDLPEGPYFVSARTGDVFKAFRLYPDHQLAFTEAGISDEEGGFMYLPAVSEVSLSFIGMKYDDQGLIYIYIYRLGIYDEECCGSFEVVLYSYPGEATCGSEFSSLPFLFWQLQLQQYKLNDG